MISMARLRRRGAGSIKRVVEHEQELRIGQVCRGDIDADVKIGPRAQGLSEISQHVADHEAGNLSYEASFLGKGNKPVRPHGKALFMVQRASASAPTMRLSVKSTMGWETMWRRSLRSARRNCCSALLLRR